MPRWSWRLVLLRGVLDFIGHDDFVHHADGTDVLAMMGYGPTVAEYLSGAGRIAWRQGLAAGALPPGCRRFGS